MQFLLPRPVSLWFWWITKILKYCRKKKGLSFQRTKYSKQRAQQRPLPRRVGGGSALFLGGTSGSAARLSWSPSRTGRSNKTKTVNQGKMRYTKQEYNSVVPYLRGTLLHEDGDHIHVVDLRLNAIGTIDTQSFQTRKSAAVRVHTSRSS